MKWAIESHSDMYHTQQETTKSMNQEAKSREETELIPLGVFFEMRKV